MNWMENLLIIAGVSLDIFAAMECQGSLVAKINKKNLTVICGIVALAQLITLYLGHFLSSLFCHYRSVPDEKLLGQIISMVIFMILGIRLMVKAIRNEHVEEHLEHHLGIRRFVRMACISGIYTLLTGIAFGFLETNVLMILIMIVVCTVAKMQHTCRNSVSDIFQSVKNPAVPQVPAMSVFHSAYSHVSHLNDDTLPIP